MPLYNLKAVRSPRLRGWILDLVSRVLRLPLVGRFVLEFLKRRNDVGDVARLARACRPPLFPLYHPMHGMTEEEEDMHARMAGEAPLDLEELAAMDAGGGGSEAEDPRRRTGGFRHWTIADYTRRYADGTVTPSRVAERLIEAIEGMDGSVVVQVNAARLRSEAERSTRRYREGKTMGVLDGVPILVKDEIPVVGFTTTRGTSIVSDPAEEDSLPILKLKRQGALIVGKTNQHEIGLGTTGFNLTYGTPRNPYGRDGRHYTGGSSSGSAAAVAMGLVPLALGGDGGGSIRIPSGLCGIVGLKPTYKRVAVDPPSCSSVFHMGPMTNNVHDAALAYAVMAGAAEDDHRGQSRMQPPVHLHAYATTMKGSSRDGNDALKGLRIGVFDEHVEDADANVVAATRRAIEHYRSRGAEIVPIALPHLQEIHVAHGIIITSEMYSHMERHYRSGNFNALSPETRVSLAVGSSWSGSDLLAALRVRCYAMRQFEDLFQNKVDLILSPAAPCVAPAFERGAASRGESDLAQTSRLMRYAIHGNLTGVPAIVVPIAYDEGTSLPIGLQLQAAHWREDLLLRAARESEGILEGGIARPAMYVDVLGTGEPARMVLER